MTGPASVSRRRLVLIAKLAVSLSIVAYLASIVLRDPNLGLLMSQEKDLSSLLAAFVFCLAAVFLTFLRWYVLILPLGIPFRCRDAVRLGCLGYVFNFVSLGSVGGDLFKAVAMAREVPDRRTKAVTSILMDRFVGLYGLLLLATIAIVSTDLSSARSEIRLICRGAVFFFLVGTAAGLCLAWPRFASGRLATLLVQLPKVGRVFAELLAAFRAYRYSLPVLVGSVLIGVSVHASFAVGFYFLASGLFPASPSLASHFVVVPLGMAAGGLPLPLGALGAYDYALSVLYATVPGGVPFSQSQGILVAVGYRLITVLIAGACTLVWFFSRGPNLVRLDQIDADDIEEMKQELDEVLASG
jgi:uncharacterized membrane protein YbhN (UPF0104 family)